ncbi:DNA-directed RNA polymerase subunit K [Candidatus Micrarchaeota archaeon CG1_02_47_40]|nr:MAG: DNA-directed RNA polymerase subunit K [Candidatus Micrarchaeota archaeon CG1_02_47_40]
MEGLNKYETTRLIGARALQLSLGAPPLIEVDGTESAIKIATREFETGIIPLVVVR